MWWWWWYACVMPCYPIVILWLWWYAWWWVNSEWGTDKRKVGEGYMWHDELAARLGGIDTEAAVSRY